jgi:hypothetical protein
MKTKRKFPFIALRMAGHKVEIIHQIGKCAVALVTPVEAWAPPYYAVRFRQRTVSCLRLHIVAECLQHLRRLDNAEIRRENEVLTADDALTQLDLTTDCFEAFCSLTGINPAHSYTRRNVRRAIVQASPPKMSKYLSLLDRLTPTETKLA